MVKTLILVGGEEQYHDVLFAGQTLQKALIEKGVVAEYSQDFTILEEPERRNQFGTIILYTQERILTDSQQKGLEEYIEKGNGFLPLHSANVINDPQNEKLIEIIGSKFDHHNPFHRFEVEIIEDHPVTEDIENFEIDDELYISEMVNESDQVLAQAEDERKKHPMVYIKKRGKGKICYLALGHDGRAWNHPQFQKLLYQAVLWAGNK